MLSIRSSFLHLRRGFCKDLLLDTSFQIRPETFMA